MKTAILFKTDCKTTDSTFERKQLENKYARYFEERPDYRLLVTYVPNKKLPVYNWFKYKEGFSRQLVYNILREWKIDKKEIILDPFAGCGTTLLACKEFGYRAAGLDILPIVIFLPNNIVQTRDKFFDVKKLLIVKGGSNIYGN